MMKFLVYISCLLLAYLVFGFYLSQQDYSIIATSLKGDHPEGFFDYKGVTNVHSNLSTGSNSPDSIINSAKMAGLDFLTFTDLNLFETIVGLEGYNGNLLVMRAGEYNYLDSRIHLYDQKRVEFLDHQDAQIKLTDYLSQKAEDLKDVFFVMTNNASGGYRWNNELPSGIGGIEILNPKAISQKTWLYSKASIFWSLLFYPFNPRYSFLRIYREPTDELSLWDQHLQKGRMVGISGSDVTGRSVPVVGYKINFPSYHRIFELMSNHVVLKSELTGNYNKDKEKVFNALKVGQFYFSLDLLGDPRGFIAYIQEGEKNHLFGSSLKYSKKQILHIALPSKPKYFYEIVIFKNGERVTSFNSWQIDWPIPSPGIYRIQVRVSPLFPLPDGYKWITWIFTNPFYIQ